MVFPGMLCLMRIHCSKYYVGLGAQEGWSLKSMVTCYRKCIFPCCWMLFGELISLIWSQILTGMWFGANVRQSSRCPDHQQIHLNFIHRIYVTPRKLHIMKVKADPKCTLCPVGAIGTFYHMVWECPGVVRFWELVADKLSAMLQVTVPLAPSVLILNELSQLSLQKSQERVFLSGLTAAKKMVATRWKPPHTLTLRQWVLSFLDVVYLKLSMVCIYGAKEGTIRLWTQAVEDLKDLLD